METINNELNTVINNLRREKPKMKDAEMLTDSIMERISLKNKWSTPTFLLIVRTISSVAAMFLLGLFTFQQLKIEDFDNNYYSHKHNHKFIINSECFDKLNNNSTSFIELYSCYLKQNSLKNKRFQIYCQQLNNSDHENNN